MLFDDRDPSYIRIVCPNFWPIESEQERALVIATSSQVTKDTKVAKVFPVEDDTWASLELFSFSDANTIAVLDRSLGALNAAVNSFLTHMQS